jgi:hypothetical protein
MSKNCRACAFSVVDPASAYGTDAVCVHPSAVPWNQRAREASAEGGHCGPARPKFKQHPWRKENGDLRP